MKKLLAIVVLFVSFTIAYASNAQTPYTGGTKTQSATLSSFVVNPIIITNVETQNPLQLPQVIQGETRTLGPNDYIVFNMTKDLERTVRFHVNFAQFPVNGVTLNGTWYVLSSKGPNTVQDLAALSGHSVIPQSGDYDTEPVDGTTLNAYLRVNSIQAAANATLGTAEFFATIEGWYTDL